MSRFVDLLAGDVLRCEDEYAYTGTETGYFIIYIGSIIRKAETEPAADIESFLVILQHFDAAENDYAADMQGPFAFLMPAAVIDTEGGFGIAPEGIYFMAGFTAVEIEFAVFLVVVMVDRQTIRIAVITDYR